MNLINTGIDKGLIRFDENRDFIAFIHQNIKKNYNNPEEKVYPVIIYGYPANRVKQFVSVQMGSETKEADIIVFNDDDCKSPEIFVDCKKVEIINQQVNLAVVHAYSHANSGNAQTKYVWVTSKLKNQYYKVGKELANFITHINKSEL